MVTSLRELVPVLQVAVGPVILISGVGLVLLNLTNRLGRLVDRVRSLVRERTASGPEAAARIEAQIAILRRRTRILRRSIQFAGLTLLTTALLILTLFLSAVFEIDSGAAVVLVFCAGQVSLIVCIAEFLRDMNLSLEALRLEAER